MNKLSTLLFLIFFIGTAGAQTFTRIDTLPTGSGGRAAWGDYDHDGFQDLVYMTQSFPSNIATVYHNVGNVFTPIAQTFPYVDAPIVKWADLDNDGFDDLILMGFDSTGHDNAYIYKSNGDGTFTQQVTGIAGLSWGGIDVTDYNNDGLKDIAIMGEDSFDFSYARIYKNMGGFSFTNIHAPVVGAQRGEVKWGDFNNDGLPDLVINGLEDTNTVARIYQNMGADSFAQLPLYISGTALGTVQWLDYDYDGKLDLMVNGVDSLFSVNFSHLYHNDGAGSFSMVSNNLPLYGEPSGSLVADLNNDGIPDVVLVGALGTGPNASICIGNGTSIYTIDSFLTTLSALSQPIAIAADIDNDGDQDMMLGNVIFRNDGPGATGVNDVSHQVSAMRISPNPATDVLNVTLSVAGISISVYDATGKVVYTGVNTGDKTVIDVHNMTAGVYIIKAGDKAQQFVISR